MRKYYTRVLNLFYIFSIFLDVTECKCKNDHWSGLFLETHSQGVEGHACDSDGDLSFSLNLLFLQAPSEAQLQHALSSPIWLLNGPCKLKPNDCQAVLVVL